MGAKRAKTISRKLKKNEAHAIRQKRIKYIVGAVLIVLMVTSIFGVMLYADPSTMVGGEQSLDIEGYTFTLQSEEGIQFVEMTATPPGKELFIGTVYYAFPSELFESYFTPSIESVANTLLNATGVFLVVNVSNLDVTGADQTFALDYQAQDIARAGLAEVLSLTGTATYAGLAEESTTFQVPVVTCENATSFEPVVSFKAPSLVNHELSSVSISEENPYCITFYSTDFQSTLDLVETLKFEMVKQYE